MSAASPVSPLVDELWAARESLAPSDEDARKVITDAVDLLDSGVARAARLQGDEVVVDERAKRAILLAFRVFDMGESATGCR